jgi:hypothetical protein
VDLSMRLQIPKTRTYIVGGSPKAVIAHHPSIVYDLLGGSFTCSSYSNENVAFWYPLECLIVIKGQVMEEIQVEIVRHSLVKD